MSTLPSVNAVSLTRTDPFLLYTTTPPVVTSSPVAFVTFTPIITFVNVVLIISTFVIVGILLTSISVNSVSMLSLSLAVLFKYLSVPLYTTSTSILPDVVI